MAMAEEKKTTKKVATEKPVETPAKGIPSSAQGTPAGAKFAVIKTGGKQYIVEEGRWYEFEKLDAEEGKTVNFDEVLLVANGSDVKIGEPTVSGTKVTGKVLEQFKDDKVVVFKYKPKKRYRKTYGHRQQKSKVMIEKIA